MEQIRGQYRRNPVFSPEHLAELARLGLTAEQVDELSRHLSVIKYYVVGDSPTADVRDPLEKMHMHLSEAEKVMNRLRHEKATPALKEARACLSSGAAELDIATAVADIDTANDGTLPMFRDVLTLLRILARASHEALHVHAPKGQRRPTAPWRAVDQIVKAIQRPRDAQSVRSAERLRPAGGQAGDFSVLCSVVFDATKVAPRKARTSAEAGIRGDVERAVRAYLKYA